MSKIDVALKRLSGLPQDRQDALVREFMQLIDDEVNGEDVLSDAQWADLQARRSELGGDMIPHEDVASDFKAKFGR